MQSVSSHYDCLGMSWSEIICIFCLEKNMHHHIHENRYFLISCRLFENSQGLGVVSTCIAILWIHDKVSFWGGGGGGG